MPSSRSGRSISRVERFDRGRECLLSGGRDCRCVRRRRQPAQALRRRARPRLITSAKFAQRMQPGRRRRSATTAMSRSPDEAMETTWPSPSTSVEFAQVRQRAEAMHRPATPSAIGLASTVRAPIVVAAARRLVPRRARRVAGRPRSLASGRSPLPRPHPLGEGQVARPNRRDGRVPSNRVPASAGSRRSPFGTTSRVIELA